MYYDFTYNQISLTSFLVCMITFKKAYILDSGEYHGIYFIFQREESSINTVTVYNEKTTIVRYIYQDFRYRLNKCSFHLVTCNNCEIICDNITFSIDKKLLSSNCINQGILEIDAIRLVQIRFYCSVHNIKSMLYELEIFSADLNKINAVTCMRNRMMQLYKITNHFLSKSKSGSRTYSLYCKLLSHSEMYDGGEGCWKLIRLYKHRSKNDTVDRKCKLC